MNRKIYWGLPLVAVGVAITVLPWLSGAYATGGGTATVRNLALRSAEAARGTSELIEATVARINDGSKLVEETSKAFSGVGESVTRVGRLVTEIAAASKEQAQGIEQINQAASEIDRSNQRNALNADKLVSVVKTFKIGSEADGGDIQKQESGGEGR